MSVTAGKPNTPELLRKDLRTLALFIRVYCQDHHQGLQPVTLHGFDLKEIAGKDLALCPECTKLLTHAFVKRSHCPMDPKPMCKHCPEHCYHPTYRAKVQEVMRYSGKKMVLSGRVDYLLHLLF